MKGVYGWERDGKEGKYEHGRKGKGRKGRRDEGNKWEGKCMENRVEIEGMVKGRGRER